TAATLVPDVPMVFGAEDEVSYRPSNFDKRSHGVVRLRTALASSLNVPAVYTASRIGLPVFLATLRDLGFTLPADAVFDPFSAWMICSILSDPSARATGFGTRTYFRTTVPAMFKSGTSSEFTNLWCIGATPRFTVGAWAGNFDGRAVINKTGSIVPTQIVSDILNRLSEEYPLSPSARDFTPPAGVVSARIDTVNGMSATPFSDSTRTEYFRDTADVPPPGNSHAD